MASTPTYRAVERASESLYEDERLRSNLTDAEAEVILTWATDWLADRASAARDEAGAQRIVQAETPRVRAALAAMNDAVAGSSAPTLAQAIAMLEPTLTGDKPFTREELLTLLSSLAGAAWKARG